MDNYRLHLRITALGSPDSGQPYAGGPGAGEVIVDQEIDLRQWVAARGGLNPANSAVETEPTTPVGPPPTPAQPAVTAPAAKPALTTVDGSPVSTQNTQKTTPGTTAVMDHDDDDDDSGPEDTRSRFDPSRSA